MIDLLLIVLTIYFLITIPGIGLALVLTPQHLRHLWIWFAPWFGIAFITILGATLNVAKIDLSVGAPIIFIVGTVLVYIALAVRKIALPSRSQILENALLVIAVIGVTAYMIYPMAVHLKFPTTLSLGNLDPVAYVNVAEFLQMNTVSEGSELDIWRPYTWSVVDLLHYGFRWGPSMLLGYLARLMQVQVYSIYTLLLALVYSLGIAPVYMLLRTVLKRFSIVGLISIVIFYGLHTLQMYWAFNAFLPQFLFTGLFSLIVIYAISVTHSKYYIPALAILFSSIATIYPDGFFIAFIPAGFIIFRVSKKAVLQLLSSIVLIQPFTFATMLEQVQRLFNTTTDTTFIGWEYLRYPSLFELFGLHSVIYSQDLHWILDLITSVPVLVIAFVGAFTITHKKKLSVFFGFAVALLMFYGGIVQNFFVFHRALSYEYFLFAVLFAAGIVYGAQRLPKKVFVMLFIALVFVALRVTDRTHSQYFYHARSIDEKILSLRELPDVEPIVTYDLVYGEYDLWQRVWTEHMLRERTIVTRQNYGLVKEQGPFQYVLVDKQKAEGEDPDGVVLFDSTYWKLVQTPSLIVTEDMR